VPSDPCEILFELFEGPTGKTHLGRLLAGHEAGRLVALRQVSVERIEELRPVVDVARSIAHPRLAKVLGIVGAGGETHVAAEYVPGVCLLELTTAARAQRVRLPPNIAIRIVRDALLAAQAAKKLMLESAELDVQRSFFSDTVWIAEFGETFVTEVGVAALLNDAATLVPADRRQPKAFLASQKGDVYWAGVELYQLLTNTRFDEKASFPFNQRIPAALAPSLTRSLSKFASLSFASPEAMATALSDLPAELMASEDEIARTVQGLAQEILEGRKAKLGLFERAAAARDFDDMTQVYRSADMDKLREQDTARPEPAPGVNPAVYVPPAERLPNVSTSAGESVVPTPRAPSAPDAANGLRASELLTSSVPPPSFNDETRAYPGGPPLDADHAAAMNEVAASALSEPHGGGTAVRESASHGSTSMERAPTSRPMNLRPLLALALLALLLALVIGASYLLSPR
jgi:hypothetical protein